MVVMKMSEPARVRDRTQNSMIIDIRGNDGLLHLTIDRELRPKISVSWTDTHSEPIETERAAEILNKVADHLDANALNDAFEMLNESSGGADD